MKEDERLKALMVVRYQVRMMDLYLDRIKELQIITREAAIEVARRAKLIDEAATEMLKQCSIEDN